MFYFWIKIFVFIALVSVFGCGFLPKPSEQGINDFSNPLLHLRDSDGLVIAPLYNAPATIASPVAEHIAEGLRLHDIPATSVNILNSGKLLEGWYQLENSRAGRVDIVLKWQLSDKKGEIVLETVSRVRVRLLVLTHKPETQIQIIADGIIPLVARAIIGKPTPISQVSSPELAIGVVKGASITANQTLRQALKTVLHRSEIKIVDSPITASAYIDGTVKITRISEQNNQVRCVWKIRDRHGIKIVTFRQESTLPHSRLIDHWDSLALDIALALRPQIIQTIKHLGTNPNNRLTVPPSLQ